MRSLFAAAVLLALEADARLRDRHGKDADKDIQEIEETLDTEGILQDLTQNNFIPSNLPPLDEDEQDDVVSQFEETLDIETI